MARYDVVIIGGGFAGASTAWWLRKNGTQRVLILEQELFPGMHASGKNAGMARQAIAQLPTTRLASRSVSFIRRPPPYFSDTRLFTPSGGFLLSQLPKDPRLETLQLNAGSARLSHSPVERDEVLERLPFLEGAPFRSAMFCPGDGLVDIHALLTGFLADTEVRSDTKVTGFRLSGRVINEVETNRGSFATEWVVNAGGAWAGPIGKMAGASFIPMVPKRRHLLHTGHLDRFDPKIPYAWSIDPAVYFRPESGGLLLSSCDGMDWPPCGPPSDNDAAVWLAEKLEQTMPKLADLPIARIWAELRCFTPDENFIIGRDGKVSNFFWTCGLGGHGMTTSWAVGEMAADLILGRTPVFDPGPFDPGRFS